MSMYKPTLKDLIKKIKEMEITEKDLRKQLLEAEIRAEKAGICPMTKLPRYSELVVDEMERIVQHAKRSGEHVVLLYADLDGLKRINDTYGHAAGDGALRETAISIRTHLRSSDYMVRKGGDEFIALLLMKPKPSEKMLREIILKLQQAIKENPLEFNNTKIPLSASMGAKVINFSKSLEEEIATADKKLYRNKEEKA